MQNKGYLDISLYILHSANIFRYFKLFKRDSRMWPIGGRTNVLLANAALHYACLAIKRLRSYMHKIETSESDDATPSKCMPPPLKCGILFLWSWSLTCDPEKPFVNSHSRDDYLWHVSLWRTDTSRAWTGGRHSRNKMLFAAYCWRRQRMHKKFARA